MSQTKKQSCGIKRREFCQAVPAAALGVFSASRFLGMKNFFSKEENMAKKVKEVIAKVISVKGTCGNGHKVGDVVKFTETKIEGSLCIHALYSMLPKVFAMMYNAQFPWAKNPDIATHPCTDAENPVVFEIKRIYEG
jgi:uncharacterized repeat protein (TIGR04076 family)